MELSIHSFTRSSGWSPDLPKSWDSKQTLVLCFGASSFRNAEKVFGQLKDVFPNSHLLGCSTAGEIHGASLRDESLALAVARFRHTDLRMSTAEVEADRSRQAGEALARQLQDPSLCGVLVFSDGLRINGSDLVEGFNVVLPESVPVMGGLAADGDRFEQTWVLEEGLPRSGRASALGFYGERLRIGHGSRGGWDIFGPERRVTRSFRNVLYELDGRPALDLYKEYLGELASELPASALLFPLALRASDEFDDQVVRTVLAVDETHHSLTFAGDVPEGYLAQLMKANYDRLIDGAGSAALSTRNRTPVTHGEDVLAIAVSCVGRRLVLGERTEEELEVALEILPEDTRQVGFYSYGEISPRKIGKCDLLNQTMTLTTFFEEAS